MNIVIAKPPNYEEILKVLPAAASPGVIFTYGDTIYNPGGGHIADHIMQHEQVHSVQQSEIGIEAWWQQYLSDQKFRLEQEIEAYQHQWKTIQTAANRHGRRVWLCKIADDLSGAVYGNLISKDEAIGRIIA